MLWRCRGQAPARGEDGEEESGGGHEVEHTVDAEARREVRPDEWANHRAEPTREDELAAPGYDSVGGIRSCA
jgi:hypothetical protein